MEHIAILHPYFLERILAGGKTMESRWLANRSAPWGKVRAGDMIYLKPSGGPVVAKALAGAVQEFSDLTPERVRALIREHKEALGVAHDWERLLARVERKRYCVLVTLTGITEVTPFPISKRGFGNQAAWLTVPEVASLRR